MSVGILTLIVLAIAVAGYVLGRWRSSQSVSGDIRLLHSLPGYHGQTVLFFCTVPAFLLIGLWLLVQPVVIDSRISAEIADTDIPAGGSLDLVMSDVRRIAAGLDLVVTSGKLTEDALDTMRADRTDVRGHLAEVGVAVGSNIGQNVFLAAQNYRRLDRLASWAMTVLVLLAAIGGAALAYVRIAPDFRARNVSEAAIKTLLVACSTVAILTTVGIVFSLIFETATFFGMYPATDFFLSLTWNPQFRGGSELGIIPLLWGTLYVSFVALLFAVPIGLMAAVYLAEYASRPVRAIAKPVIEVLAGIPTIVYGLFALITVGPMLRDYFAQPLGLGDSSSSVLTAGLVMGVMLIPFVSSLSDDAINAVPQSMRDGSLGLGATRSETVKQVVMPAALPGIVGAILLAGSRAIGETMIVVMGAGAAAKLDLNPFEAMTTITVKIVSQLTGDTEFASPETLVAFALGLSLFVITLGLNIVALYVVRKYREQYE